MMSCDEAEFMISRLVDADLCSDSEAELKRHVESCSRCRTRLEEDQNVTSLLSEALTLDITRSYEVVDSLEKLERDIHGETSQIFQLPGRAPASFGPSEVVVENGRSSSFSSTGSSTILSNNGLSPRPVVFMQESHQQVEPFEYSEDSALGVQTLRKTTILTDTPDSSPEQPPVRLELERVNKKFFRFVDHQWK